MTPPSSNKPPKFSDFIMGYPTECPDGKPQVYSIKDEPSYLYVDVDCNYDKKSGEGREAPDIMIAYDPNDIDMERLYKSGFVWTGIKGDYLDPKGRRREVDFGMPGWVFRKFVPIGESRKETLAYFIKKDEKGKLRFTAKRPESVDINPGAKTDAPEVPKPTDDGSLCGEERGFFPLFDLTWPPEKKELWFKIQTERFQLLFSHPLFGPHTRTNHPFLMSEGNTGYYGRFGTQIDEIVVSQALGLGASHLNSELLEIAEELEYREPYSNLFMEANVDMFPGPFERIPGIGRVCGDRMYTSELEGMTHRTKFQVPDMRFVDLDGEPHYLYDFLKVTREVPAPATEKRQKMAFTGESLRLYTCSINNQESLDYIQDVLIPFRKRQLGEGLHPDAKLVFVFVDENNPENLSKIGQFIDENSLGGKVKLPKKGSYVDLEKYVQENILKHIRNDGDLDIPVLLDPPKLTLVYESSKKLAQFYDPFAISKIEKYWAYKIDDPLSIERETGWPLGGELWSKLRVSSRPGFMFAVHPQISDGEVTGWHNGPRFYANEYDEKGELLKRLGYQYFDTHHRMPDWAGVDHFGNMLHASDITVGGGEFITHVFISLDGEDGKPLKGDALRERLDAATEKLDEYYINHEQRRGFRNVRLVLLFLNHSDDVSEEGQIESKASIEEAQRYFRYHIMPNGEPIGYGTIFVSREMSEGLISAWELDESELRMGGRIMTVQSPYRQENATSEYIGRGDRVAATLLPGRPAASFKATYVNKSGQFDPSTRKGKYSIVFFMPPDKAWLELLEGLQGDLKGNTNVGIEVVTPFKPTMETPSFNAEYVNREGNFDPSKPTGKYTAIYFGYPDQIAITELEAYQRQLTGNKDVEVKILGVYPKQYIEGTVKPFAEKNKATLPKKIPWAVVDERTVPRQMRKLNGILLLNPDGKVVHFIEGTSPSKVPWSIVDEEKLRKGYHTDAGAMVVGPDGKIVDFVRPENLSVDFLVTLKDIFSSKSGITPSFVEDKIGEYRKKIIDIRQEEQERRRKLADPINMKMVGPNGSEVDLSKIYENGKKTYIITWATWCKPCQSHVEGFNKIAKLVSENPEVNLIFVNVDKDDSTLAPDSEEIKKFFEEGLKNGGKPIKNYSMPYVYTAKMKDFKDLFGPEFGIPTLLVLGGEKQSGIVKHQFPMGSDDAFDTVFDILKTKKTSDDHSHGH